MPDYPVKDGAGNTIIASANPSGSNVTGADFSANKPALLGTVLSTVPYNASRMYIEVMNEAATDVQVVLYNTNLDGLYGVITLAAGIGANKEGADWTSSTFKGKVEVRGAGGEQVYVHEE